MHQPRARPDAGHAEDSSGDTGEANPEVGSAEGSAEGSSSDADAVNPEASPTGGSGNVQPVAWKSASGSVLNMTQTRQDQMRQ